VLAYVVALLVECGEADFPHADGSGKTEILIGERHLGSEGASRRVLFVPSKGGKLGPVLEIGARQIRSWTPDCAVYVWGNESANDLDRYREAERITMRVVAALNEAGVGRIEFGSEERLAGTNVVTYGEEFRILFDYSHAIPRDAAIDAAAETLAQAGATSQSPQDPDRPDGGSGLSFNGINVTMANERP
jgi:hypothetical protein